MALQCYQCSGTEDDCKKSTLESDKDKYLSDNLPIGSTQVL